MKKGFLRAEQTVAQGDLDSKLYRPKKNIMAFTHKSSPCKTAAEEKLLQQFLPFLPFLRIGGIPIFPQPGKQVLLGRFSGKQVSKPVISLLPVPGICFVPLRFRRKLIPIAALHHLRVNRPFSLQEKIIQFIGGQMDRRGIRHL